MDINNAINSCKVLRNANNNSLEMLRSYGKLSNYSKGELLIKEKQSIEDIYFVINGTVALFKERTDFGKKVVLIYSDGELINDVALNNDISSINVECMRRSYVLGYKRKEFDEILSNDFQLTKAIMNSMCQEISKLYNQLYDSGEKTNIDNILAKKIWKLARDHGYPTGESIEIGFDIDENFLGDLVGVDKETICSNLSKLEDNSLIEVENKRLIVVDFLGLEKYICLNK